MPYTDVECHRAPRSTATLGERIHGYVPLADHDGIRHAIRPSAVLCMSDGDFSQNMTAIQLPGRCLILVAAALEGALAALR
jgi:hypothetical protein